MARKWFDERVPPAGAKTGKDHKLAVLATSTTSTVLQAMQSFAFKTAAESILQLAIAANGHLNDTAPWSRMKQPGQEADVADDLYVVLESARIVGVLLSPLLPDLSERLLAQLGFEPVCSAWHGQLAWGGLQSGALLPQPSPVMQRLELEDNL
jgi:methionyl-tRNA synthetase